MSVSPNNCFFGRFPMITLLFHPTGHLEYYQECQGKKCFYFNYTSRNTRTCHWDRYCLNLKAQISRSLSIINE